MNEFVVNVFYSSFNFVSVRVRARARARACACVCACVCVCVCQHSLLWIKIIYHVTCNTFFKQNILFYNIKGEREKLVVGSMKSLTCTNKLWAI